MQNYEGRGLNSLKTVLFPEFVWCQNDEDVSKSMLVIDITHLVWCRVYQLINYFFIWDWWLSTCICITQRINHQLNAIHLHWRSSPSTDVRMTLMCHHYVIAFSWLILWLLICLLVNWYLCVIKTFIICNVTTGSYYAWIKWTGALKLCFVGWKIVAEIFIIYVLPGSINIIKYIWWHYLLKCYLINSWLLKKWSIL